MDGTQSEIELMQQVSLFIDGKLKEEFVGQGHHLTGAFEGSLHGTVLNTGMKTQLRGQMASYGIFVNTGVNASRIPYNEGSGAGTSKYITALINYWKLRGLNEKEATRAAFATAKTHKKEGMPSAGSYMFSSTGQRKSFITIVKTESGPEVNKQMMGGLNNIVRTIFNETKSQTI